MQRIKLIIGENFMDKTYTNIMDVSTTNLLKMLDMDRFKDNAHQKMIKDELKCRVLEALLKI